MTATAETRRTDWFAFGHYGYSHYRIWQMFDGLRWFQRHEWKREDGTTEIEKWINGVSGWLTHAEPEVAA